MVLLNVAWICTWPFACIGRATTFAAGFLAGGAGCFSDSGISFEDRITKSEIRIFLQNQRNDIHNSLIRHLHFIYVFCDVGFLPEPIVLRTLPRTVREFVLVRWPRDGRFFVCRVPR